jgi:glyoxylase-like metal-dependent hydrolase (beta-lactamase superfamily II)
MSLSWGGPEIILEHHPGPSIGALWLIIPDEKIIFTGDTVTVDQPPFLAHADISEWLNALSLLQKTYKDFTIVAGRGGLASTETIRSMITGLKNTIKGLERLSKKRSPPEETEKLIESLMDDFNVPSNMRDRHYLRLQYGLFQNYARRYRPSNSLETITSDESDQ